MPGFTLQQLNAHARTHFWSSAWTYRPTSGQLVSLWSVHVERQSVIERWLQQRYVAFARSVPCGRSSLRSYIDLLICPTAESINLAASFSHKPIHTLTNYYLMASP